MSWLRFLNLSLKLPGLVRQGGSSDLFVLDDCSHFGYDSIKSTDGELLMTNLNLVDCQGLRVFRMYRGRSPYYVRFWSMIRRRQF
jgi:hypothetical protein